MAKASQQSWKQEEWLECRRAIRHWDLGLLTVRLAALLLAVCAVASLSAGEASGLAPIFVGWGLSLSLVVILAALDLSWTRLRIAAWLRSVRLEIEGLGLLGTGLGTEALKAGGGGGWPVHAFAAYTLAAATASGTALALLGVRPTALTLGSLGVVLLALGILYLAASYALSSVRRDGLRLREVVSAEPFFTAGEIATSVKGLAEEVRAWLASDQTGANGPLILVSILHGARYVVRDLVPLLEPSGPVRVVPVRVTSAPGVGKRTAPVLEYGPLDETVFRGRRVLIVDDILDTGETIRFVRDQIGNLGPASIRTAVFLKKYQDVGVAVDFAAFDLGIAKDSPAQRYWFFGYGMDADGDFRDLPVVGAVDSASFRRLVDKAGR